MSAKALRFYHSVKDSTCVAALGVLTPSFTADPIKPAAPVTLKLGGGLSTALRARMRDSRFARAWGTAVPPTEPPWGITGRIRPRPLRWPRAASGRKYRFRHQSADWFWNLRRLRAHVA